MTKYARKDGQFPLLPADPEPVAEPKDDDDAPSMPWIDNNDDNGWEDTVTEIPITDNGEQGDGNDKVELPSDSWGTGGDVHGNNVTS